MRSSFGPSAQAQRTARAYVKRLRKPECTSVMGGFGVGLFFAPCLTALYAVKMWAWPSLRKSPIAYANSPMSWLIRNPCAAARYRNAPSVVAKRVAPAPITPRPATVLITA